jgi:hypothetical protein
MPYCATNVSGNGCVTVCGLSAYCLRQVGKAADVLPSIKNQYSIF